MFTIKNIRASYFTLVFIHIVMICIIVFFTYYEQPNLSKKITKLNYYIVCSNKNVDLPFVQIDTTTGDKIYFSENIILDTIWLHEKLEINTRLSRVDISDTKYFFVRGILHDYAKEYMTCYILDVCDMGVEYTVFYHKKYGVLLKESVEDEDFKVLYYVFIIRDNKRYLEWKNKLIDYYYR